jgi:trigger factor
MQASFESHGQFERKVTIAIPAQEIDTKIAQRLTDIAKKVKIPGFRPGKVPKKMLEERYGENVRHEVVEAAINNALHQAISEEKIMPANTPHVHMEQNANGQDLKFYAHFEVYPDVKLNGLEAISMDIPMPVVSDEDIADVIQRIQKAHAQWIETDNATELGNRVTVNFTGVILGEEHPFTDEKDVQIILGDKRMIPGFEDELLGLKKGDRKQFTITFPENYAPKLANKKTEFSLEMVKVEKGDLPEITDEFCQQTLNMTDGSVTQLKEKIRENLLQEANEKIRRTLHQEVLIKFADLNPVEVPPSLIKNELKLLKENQDDPRLPDNIRESDEAAMAEATKRVLYSLILGQYIRDNAIQLDQKKVQAAVMNMARSSQDPEGMLRWFMEDKKRINPVSSLVLEEQALDQLLQQVKRNEKEVPYKQIMDEDK